MDQNSGILYFVGLNTSKPGNLENLIGRLIVCIQNLRNFARFFFNSEKYCAPIRKWSNIVYKFNHQFFFGAGQSINIDAQNSQFIMTG